MPKGFGSSWPLDGRRTPEVAGALTERERDAIAQAAGEVKVTDEVATLLAQLRQHLEEAQVYVSDRRWMKIVWLLKTAAATEGRDELCLWDLWLLPWCTAHDVEGQATVRDWLLTRLGVREALSPPRLARVVEAFEAQASLEGEADDLDYDSAGRLKFSTELDQRVPDAKGASQVARLRYTRRRRYGDTHVGARVRQIDELLARIAGYAEELGARRADLAAYAGQSLWIDHEFVTRIVDNLDAIAACARRPGVSAPRGQGPRSRRCRACRSIPAPDPSPSRTSCSSCEPRTAAWARCCSRSGKHDWQRSTRCHAASGSAA